MFKDLKLRYLNAASNEDTCLGTIDKVFETEEEVAEYIEDFAPFDSDRQPDVDFNGGWY